MKNGIQYHAYTDGTCKPNPGDGGWGLVIVSDVGVKAFHGGALNTTNNEMELTATLEAVNTVPNNAKVKVITDSKLVKGFIDGSYKCKAPNLLPLVTTIRLTIINRGLDFSIEWVKAHQKGATTHSQFNELADDLALMGYQEVKNDQ